MIGQPTKEMMRYHPDAPAMLSVPENATRDIASKAVKSGIEKKCDFFRRITCLIISQCWKLI